MDGRKRFVNDDCLRVDRVKMCADVRTGPKQTLRFTAINIVTQISYASITILYNYPMQVISAIAITHHRI